MSHKNIQAILVRFFEQAPINRIVFDDIDPHGKAAATEFYQTRGVFQTVVKALKSNVFVGNAVPRLLIEVLQALHQRLQVIGFVDGHDLVTLLVVGSVQAHGEIAAEAIVGQFADHFGDARRADGDAPG